jgi:hypothetical protein
MGRGEAKVELIVDHARGDYVRHATAYLRRGGGQAAQGMVEELDCRPSR